jgi:SAM-dependent methyltransferase
MMADGAVIPAVERQSNAGTQWDARRPAEGTQPPNGWGRLARDLAERPRLAMACETPGVDDSVDVFRTIYENDLWKGGSGAGSSADATTEYRRLLESLVARRQIRSVVDVGCGDWQVSRLVDWRRVRYTGVDIVPELVSSHTQKFGSRRTRFVAADARTARLPRADLLLCKDVLQHWPNQSIVDFLGRNLGRFRYALLTNDVWSAHEHDGVNADVPLGGWRPIDLEVTPFEVRARWRYDFDIGGEWTKRVVFVAR